MSKKKSKKVDNKKVMYMIITMIVVLCVGTYAWFTWRSNETALVLTVGDVSGLSVTLAPYKFNSSITPTATYSNDENEYVQVTAVNNSSSKDYMIDLFYKINSMADELIDTGFKYTILRSTDGSNYSSYATGNFSTALSGNDYTILSDQVIGIGETYYYRVYIWIDSSSGNQANMQGKIFNAELRANYEVLE